MDYFRYNKAINSYEAMQIFDVVQQLKGYAGKIYKGSWEDALDSSFFHILRNYNKDSGGELEHYATKVVNTILLGKYKDEITHEVSLETGMNKLSMDASYQNPMNILITDDVEVSADLESCIHYLLPSFIEDYKFFKSRKPEDRKLSYKGLFDMYSSGTIVQAMDYMVKNYGQAVEDLLAIKRKCHYRNFSKDRYKNSLDTSIEYDCMLNNVLLYKRVSGRSTKKFFFLNLRETITRLIEQFYTSGERNKIMGDYTVYCSLSGNLIIGEDELYDTLEREIVGAILARSQNMKVAVYEHNENMIVTASRDLDEGFTLSIFDEDFPIVFKKIISKCINR